jgi:hypothetical protein
MRCSDKPTEPRSAPQDAATEDRLQFRGGRVEHVAAMKRSKSGTPNPSTKMSNYRRPADSR